MIKFTDRAAESTERLDDRLNRFILQFFADCDEKDLNTLEEASRIVCRVLDSRDENEGN